RARNGRDRQRPRPPWLPRLRRDLPGVQRLYASRGAALGIDEASLDLGVHARLDRPRRGRPHSPADRAARQPPGDASDHPSASCRGRVWTAAGGARLAVGAASALGRAQWMGEAGAFMAMESLAAAGPYNAAYEHSAITAQRVAEVGRELIARWAPPGQA